ncbi:putative NADPH-quinone reductase (modulator of drug activity B) [Galbibacter orientalis DSM 19592]|uniref:Putative NADPH-quinone reductase (Modulator of drug activity B) n=1 Tax=Galbibacter orientalis DSM 19592 TaxID=926559 RepID=I3CAL8_9FLAO|nr:NAD(P)H-dependent oxidoreductase [Galbibacter orientalis]EIJ40661.1 putative NADPH-quinone reductase (modulator of drug activity B) [Galbibacter orientalis DSM 19592]
MKHLIIYCHPNTKSLNSTLKDYVVEYLQENNNEVYVRDLYALNFNPVLSFDDLAGQLQGVVAADVKQEQDFITWADCITIIHPIWWTGLPAIMKGYIDRVFSYGFAYRYDAGVQKGLLTGKKVVIINTHGKSHREYQSLGMDKALSLTSDTGIYTYSGLEIIKHFFFDQADKVTTERVAMWKQETKKAFL